MELAQGTRVDRYEVLSLLGSGGLASVYRVRHTELDAPRALKVLHISGGTRLERLRREGRLQATLHHPGIVQVMDVVPLPGGVGLVMELVEGSTLRDWLAAEAPELTERLRIFQAVVEAVGHAHEHRIIHRDLKPENVLMSRVRGTWQPKVTDFGLARALAEEGPSATRSGVGMGTPRYMAPEQIRDASRVDEQADVFALGCLLHLLACGREAFDGDNPAAIWAAILRGSVTDPATTSPGLAPSVAATIRACLRTLPAERPRGCGGVLSMLAGAAPPPVARAADSTFDGGWLDATGAAEASVEPTLARPAPTLAPPETEFNPLSTEPGDRAPAPGPLLVPAPPRRPVGLLTAAGFAGIVALALWAWPRGEMAPTRDAPLAAPVSPPVEVPGPALEPLLPVPAEPAPAALAPAGPAPPSRAAATSRPDPAQPETAQPEAVVADLSPSVVTIEEVPALPPPEPEAAPPATQPEPTGTVEVSGPGEVKLRASSSGRTYPPGAIPPGHYEIEVRFGDRKGSGFAFDLAAGQTVTVSCNESTEVCRKL